MVCDFVDLHEIYHAMYHQGVGTTHNLELTDVRFKLYKAVLIILLPSPSYDTDIIVRLTAVRNGY